MTLIADPANLRATPTGMAPSSQAFFVVHKGHQTILDSRNPLARAQLSLAQDASINPVEEREFRQDFGALVMAALGA
jgi:hypothetical protein